jgi:hypothetical protein
MPHPVRAARPHDNRVRDIKIPGGGTERGTELQKEKFIEAKIMTSLHSVRAHFDQRPPLSCAPPTLPEKVRAGRHIIQ